MASSSSAAAPASLGPPVSEKLTRENFLIWKAQILPAIKAAKLLGILNGSVKEPVEIIEVIKDDKSKMIVPNPEHDTWIAQDQQVLGYLLNSLTKEVLAQVATVPSAAAVWTALEGMYCAQ